MVSFIIAGAFIALSGVICLPLRRISVWEKSKTRIVDVEYHVVAAEDSVPKPESEDSAKVRFVDGSVTEKISANDNN